MSLDLVIFFIDCFKIDTIKNLKFESNSIRILEILEVASGTVKNIDIF